MATSIRSQWRVSSMLFAACEVAIAMLLLLQMAFAFLILHLMKRFTPVRICCNTTIGHHHALFKFGPFSLLGDFVTNFPTRKKDQRKLVRSHDEATSSKPGRDLVSTRDVNNLSCCYLKGKQEIWSSSLGKGSELGEVKLSDIITGLPFHGASTGTSLVYRRKGFRGNKEGNFMHLGDTQSWSKVIDEEEEQDASISLLTQQTTFIWGQEGHRFYKREVSHGSLIDGEDFEHSICQQGHCCQIVPKMKKTLEMERQHLHNIYMELEEERDAAETAANEAMAMILRLQEEKSGFQLEMAHYQRMAEEKTFHDEMLIQKLEDDIRKKENECLLLEEELNELKETAIRRHQPEDATKNPSPNIDKLSSLSRDHDVSYFNRQQTMGNASSCQRLDLALTTQDNPVIKEPNEKMSYDMEEEFPDYVGEEKVVNIDVANLNYTSSWKSEIPFVTQDIFEVHEGKKAGVKFLQQSEVQAEEKCLDIPSNMEKMYQTSLQSPISSVSDRKSQIYEEEDRKFKLVTLEDIDLRLQILENKTLLLRQKSLPSNDENMNMVLLKEILQELQALLHANRT